MEAMPESTYKMWLEFCETPQHYDNSPYIPIISLDWLLKHDVQLELPYGKEKSRKRTTQTENI